MKYYNIGITIFIVCLIICMFLSSYIIKNLSEIYELLEEAAELYKNGMCQASMTKVTRARQIWETKKIVYSSYLKQNKLEHISSEFKSLFELVEIGSKNEIYIKIKELSDALLKLMQSETLCWENIL